MGVAGEILVSHDGLADLRRQSAIGGIHLLLIRGRFPRILIALVDSRIVRLRLRVRRLSIDREQQGRQQQSECEYVGFCELEEMHNALSQACVGPVRRQTNTTARLRIRNSRRLVQNRERTSFRPYLKLRDGELSSTTADGDSLAAILASSRGEPAVRKIRYEPGVRAI